MTETRNRLPMADTDVAMGPKNQSISGNHENDLEIAKDNEYCGRQVNVDNHDELVQLDIEADLENQLLKSQFEGFKNIAQYINLSHHLSNVIERDPEVNDHVNEICEKIKSLSKDLHEEILTRGDAEEALKHLQTLYSEADAHAQELSVKLSEGFSRQIR